MTPAHTRPIDTVRRAARWSISWFWRLTLICAAGSAAAGFGLAFWVR